MIWTSYVKGLLRRRRVNGLSTGLCPLFEKASTSNIHWFFIVINVIQDPPALPNAVQPAPSSFTLVNPLPASVPTKAQLHRGVLQPNSSLNIQTQIPVGTANTQQDPKVLTPEHMQYMAQVQKQAKQVEWSRNPVSPPVWGEVLYTRLADAYLQWKAQRPADILAAADIPPQETPLDQCLSHGGSYLGTIDVIVGKSCESHAHLQHSLLFNIRIIGTLQKFQVTFKPTNESRDKNKLEYNRAVNEGLISHGLLSNARSAPNWAISLYLLEDFHALRMKHYRHPIAAFLKPLLTRLGMEFNKSISNRFRHTYAVYVGILRTIEQREQLNMSNSPAVIGSWMLFGPTLSTRKSYSLRNLLT